MSRQEIIIMITAGIAVAAIILVLLERHERNEKEKEGRLFIGRADREWIIQAYHMLRNNFFYGSFTKRIAKRYELIYPSLDGMIMKKTVYMAGSLTGMNVLLFVVLYLIRPSPVNLFTAVFIMYAAQISVMSMLLRRTEMRMLEHLDESLSDIKHNYMADKDIAGAVWNTMEHSKKEIRAHMNEIFQILNSVDMDEKAREYNETGKNKYLKLLLGICARTEDKGDCENEKGDSVLTQNINLLKRDIRKEVEKKKKTDQIFSGLTFVAVFPIIFLTPVKEWAVGNLVDLQSFYEGKLGFYCVVMSFLITFVVFHLLERMRDAEELYQKPYSILMKALDVPLIRKTIRWIQDNDIEAYRKKEALIRRLGEKYPVSILNLRQVAFGAGGFVIMLFVLVVAGRIEKDWIIKDNAAIYDALSQRNQKDIKEGQVDLWMKDYKGGVDGIIQKFESAGVTNENVLKELTALINKKMTEIRSSYVKWQEVLLLIAVVIFLYHYPYLMLLFKRSYIDDSMAEEVMCFQTIVTMQIYIKNITLIEILESMELFADIYRTSIQDCINGMMVDEHRALAELREKETFPPFQRLVDCFLMSDRTGTVKAFDEVADDIKHFQDVFALEQEILLKKKSNVAELIAFVPFGFITAVYLVLPFLAMGAKMYSTSFQENMEDAAG